jgi:hypothetical protein
MKLARLRPAPRVRRGFSAARAGVAIGAVLIASVLFAQDKLLLKVEEDCSAFAISKDNRIVFSVPRLKRLKKIIIERDDLWVAAVGGSKKRIVEGDKFMPVPPPAMYMVESLVWSPDGQRFAADMNVQGPPPDEDSMPQSVKSVALFEEDGREIKVAGSKTRFIENATNGTWLADGATVVYLTGLGPFVINAVRPAEGTTKALFEGHSFDAVLWDARNNQAFAVGQGLSAMGQVELLQLDLVHETIREVARLKQFAGKLSVSPSGKKIGYFEDGDSLAVLDLANPTSPVRVRAGIGRFEWSRDERRVLLKRGPDDKSGDLVWVGIHDGSFTPILHDLEFHNFAIAPDEDSIVVVEVGKQSLMVYSMH